MGFFGVDIDIIYIKIYLYLLILTNYFLYTHTWCLKKRGEKR